MYSLILLLVFLSIMISVGVWGMRKTSTLNDFFLGGRSIGPWMSAFAYGTTYFSAVVFIGFAGKQGWEFGLQSLFIGLGNAILGACCAWIFLARRTRIMTQNLNSMTLPEFMEKRYGSAHLKMQSAILIFIFLLPYSAGVFKGLAHLFESTFHISFDFALVILLGITGVYLVLGGYFAVTATDFIQGFIMIAGALAMAGVIIFKAGGIPRALITAQVNFQEHLPLIQRPSVVTIISLVFMTSFGTWGMPQMIQKFCAVKNEKIFGKATLITTAFALIIGITAYLCGAMSHVFFTPETLPKLADGQFNFDMIMPLMMSRQLPEWLLAVIMLLILSASMSTLASLVLVSASSITIDLYRGYLNQNISEHQSVLLMRILSAVFIAASYLISRMNIGFIVTLMSLSWGVVSGAFIAPYILGIFSRRVTKAGAYAGFYTGAGTAVILTLILGPSKAPLAASVAMVVPFAVVPIVSAFTDKVAASTIEAAFAGL